VFDASSPPPRHVRPGSGDEARPGIEVSGNEASGTSDRAAPPTGNEVSGTSGRHLGT